MTLSYKKYNEGTNGYRPGALNVQVNGIQIEDLYQEWVARTRECEELREKNAMLNGMLQKQGKLITELKEKLKEKDNIS